jgi:hypothetical protein
VAVACWRSGAIAAAIDYVMLCHLLIIHGGSFGYKMFCILRARQNAWTTTSFRARRITAPRHAACANNNIIPVPYPDILVPVNTEKTFYPFNTLIRDTQVSEIVFGGVPNRTPS